jgi:hypothetical protein
MVGVLSLESIAAFPSCLRNKITNLAFYSGTGSKASQRIVISQKHPPPLRSRKQARQQSLRPPRVQIKTFLLLHTRARACRRSRLACHRKWFQISHQPMMSLSILRPCHQFEQAHKIWWLDGNCKAQEHSGHAAQTLDVVMILSDCVCYTSQMSLENSI